MKWFKHDSDAKDDIRSKMLKARFGMEGYGVYWGILEFIADGIDEHRSPDTWGILPEIFNPAFLACEFRVDARTIKDMLDYMAEIGLIDPGLWKDGKIANFKILSRTDEYTEKLRKKSEKNPDKLPIKSRLNPDKLPTESGVNPTSRDQNRTEKNRTEKNREELDRVSTSGDDESIPYKKIQELWNEVCSSHYPAVQSLSDSRRRQIAARWKEHPDLEFWRKVFVRLTIAKHCLGHNDRNWRADFDFIFQNNDKYVKLLEGKYDRGNGNGGGNATVKSPPDPPKPKYLQPYPDPRIKDVPSETTTTKH